MDIHEEETRPAPDPFDFLNFPSRTMPRVSRRYLFANEDEREQPQRRGTTRDRSWDDDMLIVD